MRRRNREAELQFLWGSEGYEKKEQPRLQFRGKIDKDAVTGAKVLVHASGFQQSPYADITPAGVSVNRPPGKFWHSSPGISG